MSHGNWQDMFKAIQENDFELVKFHVENGVNVNYQHPQYFTTPLIESIRQGHHVITKYLLMRGANVQAIETYSNKNAIQIAKELGDEETIHLILHFVNNSQPLK